MEEVRVLLERAKEFLELAREACKRGMYDIAAFLSEQAVQLRLKASLLRLAGEYPRVHSVRFLLSVLTRVIEEHGFKDLAEHVKGFVRRRREELMELEDAYTSARYGLTRFTKASVEMLIRVSEEVFKLVEEVEATILG